MNETPRLKKEYNEKYRADLQKELGYDTVMEVPRLIKIVVNVGVSEATKDQAALEEVEEMMREITGQKPIRTKARKAISSFTLRKGQDIGVMTTLRGDRMWYFFDKLINIVMPRTKDFRGLPATAFDQAGNYTIGIKDHTVFPEIDPTKAQSMKSLGITIVIDSDGKKASKNFLDKFGFPFKEVQPEPEARQKTEDSKIQQESDMADESDKDEPEDKAEKKENN